MSLQQRFNEFYQSLTPESLEDLGSVYHSTVLFSDPVDERQGLDALDAYFRKLLDGCRYCHFTIRRQQFSGDWGWISWSMNFASPRLNRCREITVEGSSVLMIREDRVCFQRDYYDMGAMIYEQLPLIGRFIRFIRRRLR